MILQDVPSDRFFEQKKKRVDHKQDSNFELWISSRA